jgi:alpha-glucosidase
MPAATDPDRWWHGGVFYQIYPRSYADSNGDGAGDLPGIISRLDYLAELGIRHLAVARHRLAQPRLGLRRLRLLRHRPRLRHPRRPRHAGARGGKRGIRILLDLVPNHTSDQHPWFVDARTGPDADPPRLVRLGRSQARRGPPNNWVSIFGGLGLGARRGQRPVLPAQLRGAAARPQLVERRRARAFDDIVRFWWDRGVAGFRIDVCNMMIKDAELRDNPPATEDDPLDQQFMGVKAVYNTDRPEAHDILRRWRAISDTYDPPRLLIGETNVEQLPALMQFYGDGHNELHGGFNFVFINAPLEADAMRAVVEETEAPAARGRLAHLDGLQPRRVPPGHPLGRRRPGQGALRAPDPAHPAGHALPLPGRRDRPDRRAD